ncbi:MAG: ankyrin repeat domain-containing protein, partial [Pseudomonadota bacterium]|nr:ankyrin repeat domain-containing protein [Pseudomonadota bacterium]
MMEILPNDILIEMAKRFSVEATGRIAQTCKRWRQISNANNLWLARIKLELTEQPQLRYGESYKEHYENVYDYKERNYQYPPKAELDGDNYKCFLTRPIVPCEDSEDSYVRHSLQAYLRVACRIGAEIWFAKLIQIDTQGHIRIDYDNLLMESVRNEQLHLIPLLTNNGANINFVDKKNYTASGIFQTALKLDSHRHCLQALFNSNQPLTIIPRRHLLVIINEPELLDKNLKSDGNHAKKDRIGLSSIGWAIILGREKCLEVLVKHKVSLDEVADPDYMSNSGYTQCGQVPAMLFALARRKIKILAFLLKKFGINAVGYPYMDPYYTDICHITLLEYAVKINFTQAVELLLQSGANTHLQEAFCEAASRGFLDCLKLLASARPAVNATLATAKHEEKNWLISEDLPLTLAARSGHTPCISFLLQMHANPNLHASRKTGVTRRSYHSELHAAKHNPTLFAQIQDTRYATVYSNDTHISALNLAAKFLISIGDLYHCSFFKTLTGSSTYNEDIKALKIKIDHNQKILLEFDRCDYDPTSIENRLSTNAIENIKLLLIKDAKANHKDSNGMSALSILLSGFKK